MKNMKLVAISFTLILAMVFSTLGVFAESENLFDNIDYNRGDEIRVILEGEQLEFEVAPQIVDGKVLVPMKKIFESLGFAVTWEPSLKATRGKNIDMNILFPLNSNKVTINGFEYEMEASTQVINGSTMIPLRFLSYYMGYNVVWNNGAQLILLSEDSIIEWKYGGFEGAKPYKEYEYKYINGEKTKEYRYTGKNHDVSIVNLYRKDGGLVPNVPDFRIKDYGAGWFQKSPYIGETYWVHIDELTKGIRTNPIYLEEGLQQLDIVSLKETAEVGNYVKIKINEHYFDLQDYKKVIRQQNSKLSPVIDEATLNGKVIESNDTLFKVEINDKYNTVVAFKTLEKSIFNRDSNKIYTVLEKSPSSLFDWDSNTWEQIEKNIPWTGMTKDMLLVQYKMEPDQIAKLSTKFNDLELWVYTQDYGDSIYYFKDDVLTNIL